MEKYEKIKVVGRGAFGIVHLCQTISDKSLVIMKQIPVDAMTKEERLAALNEVKVLSILDHLNIIQYYENFLEDAALMIVMEYAEGGTLFEFLQASQKLLEEDEILKYFTQILLAIQHIHSKQILHRDLKTQNILLDKSKQVVKIVDFGISKVLTKSNAISVVGTPCYISPELCEGKPYNQKSDIWALGCILYEITTLKKAFEAPSLPALILKIMRGTFAPPADHYTSELRELILCLLQLDPDQRPTANQIMAKPIVINTLLRLLDLGSIECKRTEKALITTGSGGRVSKSVPKQNMKTDAESPVLQLKPQSKVWCWGNGISIPICLPLPSADTEITEVAISRSQKAAVTKSGKIVVWESAPYGAETDNDYVPRSLEGQSAVTIQHVSCGDLFIACVTDRGILMTFGNGSNGCLGHGDYNDVSQAKIVEALLGYEVTTVSCGSFHVMAVTNDHEVFAWGKSDSGRLGIDTEESTSFNKPVQVTTLPEGCKASNVVCGVNSSAVIMEDGRLFCTGSNRYNKLGLDREDMEHNEVIYSFMEVLAEALRRDGIRQLSLGTSHSIACTKSGQVYTFGSNQYGQLGIGNIEVTRSICLVETLANKRVICVSSGDTFSFAVTEEGYVYTWGNKSRGRLGNGDKDAIVPTRIDIKTGSLRLVSALASHGGTIVAFAN